MITIKVSRPADVQKDEFGKFTFDNQRVDFTISCETEEEAADIAKMFYVKPKAVKYDAQI